jgi:hypothetical protein
MPGKRKFDSGCCGVTEAPQGDESVLMTRVPAETRETREITLPLCTTYFSTRCMLEIEMFC